MRNSDQQVAQISLNQIQEMIFWSAPWHAKKEGYQDKFWYPKEISFNPYTVSLL